MSIKSDLIALLLTDESIMIAAPMSDEMKKQVLKLEMKRLEELVPFINEGMEEAFEEEDAIVVILDNTVKNERIENSYDEKYGARPIKRYVSRNIETLLAKAIINEEIKYKENIIIDVNEDVLFIKKDC